MKPFYRIGSAVLLVMLLSGVGIVSAASRGDACVRVAATTVSKGVSLRCVRTVSGSLVWRLNRSISPTSVVTSTTSSSSTTVAVVPSVSLAATFIDSGKFPKAAVVTTNVAGTVYFIEGASLVNTVSDITSARYYRWTSGVVTANTPTSIALDVDVLTNGYYRVFVANSQGVLSEPAFNKVTISIPRVSDVAALTCATGGVCVVGDTGPGGGAVFYVQAAGGTFPCGATLTSTCRYLEAAPANWLTDTTGDPFRSWATDTDPGVGTGNQATAVTGARGTEIGSGYKNSLAVVAQTGNLADTSAAVLARAYQGNSKTDWYLPSKDELNQMCKWQRGQLWVSDATICNNTGTLNSGRGASGFIANDYWSSSEFGASAAWYQDFNFGDQRDLFKSSPLYVRPVRAF